MLPMFSEHSSGWKRRAAAARSSSVIAVPPPVVMLITASSARLDLGQELREDVRVGGRPAGLRVAGVEVEDRRAGLGRGDRLLGDLAPA